MIAVSDAVLILVSVTALVFGLNRWQNNLQPSSRPSVPTQTQNIVVPQAQDTNTISTPVAPVAPVIVAEPSQPEAIVADTSANDEADDSTAPLGSYIVQSGDSLSKIAVQYDTSVSQLQSINQLEGTVIKVGQELKYPLPAN